MTNFWKHQKVLITGANGFIGSHLVKKLIDLDADVIVLNHKIFSKNLILNQSYIDKTKEKIIAKIEDKEAIFDVFKKNKPTFVFHLAAQPIVELGDKDPLSTFETNIMGTANILEAARKFKTKGIIIASSAHVYGQNKVPLLEEYFPQPSRPYETSKACADILAQTYAIHYKLPIAIARFVNIYGPGDNNQRLIPRTIKLLKQKESPIIYNNKIVRDFLYIDDAIDAYLTLAKKIKKNNIDKSNIVYNFGSGQQYTVGKIINLIIKLMSKKDIQLIYENKTRPNEIIEQYLDITKAKKILNWQAKYSLENGLKETINWYQQNE